MDKKELNCSEKDFTNCPTCGIKLDKKYLGERCPRCNSIVMPKGCESCKNTCR